MVYLGAQRTCPVAANVVLFLLNVVYKEVKQMWLFLNVLYVTVQSLIKFYEINFSHFISGMF